MASRAQTFIKLPWTGGWNTSVDPGVLPDTDLVVADNIVFAASGSRLKREGFDWFDEASALPSIVSRASSGTTRTIVFSTALQDSSPAIHRLSVGERITITSEDGAEGDYAGVYSVSTISASTITYTALGSFSESTTAVSSSFDITRRPYIDLRDFWYTDSNGVKQRVLMAVTDQGKIYKHDEEGRRTEVTPDATTGKDIGTPFGSGTLVRVMSKVINNKWIAVFSGVGNYPVYYDPVADDDEYFNLGGDPPDCDMVEEHLGRLWVNDKLDRERIHYSSTQEPEEWLGIGDSGALDIGLGDGDPEGISAIFPPFKGRLFVAKKNKTSQIAGYSPEDFQIIPVSNGIGAETAKAAVAVDFDDVVYVSRRGFHSLASTNNYGDFESQYLSTKIKPEFESLNKLELRDVHGVYIPELNSLIFSIQEEGELAPSTLWLFSTQTKEWYRWPDISARSLAAYQDSIGKLRLIYGTADGYIYIAQNGDFNDVGNTAIRYRIRTGQIYVDGNPNTVKGFKKLGFFYKPKGRYNFTVRVWIDNIPVQSLSFQQDSVGDVLGVDFILGQSVLGADDVFAPFTTTIDGYGRSLRFEIENSNLDEQVEIYGYAIEWEPAGTAQETE